MNLSEMQLTHHYSNLLSFIDTLLIEFPNKGKEGVFAYFARRSQHQQAIIQDLLPLLIYEVVGQRDGSAAIPLSASWALNLGAAHWLDHAQDKRDLNHLFFSSALLGVANMALSKLETDADTIRDLIEAIGRVTVIGIDGQRSEMEYGRVWSKTQYFGNIAGKSAAIIATGIWLGGRLATDDPQILTSLKELGLALGMTIQLSDDCLDLVEDLLNGTYTLGVLEGLACVTHPLYPELNSLTAKGSLSVKEAERVLEILRSMGAITACERVIRAYQIQTVIALSRFPGLEQYFGSYVACKT